MQLSFQLDRVNDTTFRGIVFQTMEVGYRPVTSVYDIAEGDYLDLCIWLEENYPNLNTVRLRDGTFEEADELTLMEAAEANIPFEEE